MNSLNLIVLSVFLISTIIPNSFGNPTLDCKELVKDDKAIMEILVKLIQDEEYELAEKMFNRIDAMKDNLEDLIKTTIKNNGRYSDNLIKFFDVIDQQDLTLEAYEVLVNMLKDKRGFSIVTIAYRIVGLLLGMEKTDKDYEKVGKIYNELPQILRQFPRQDSTIKLVNQLYKEYLISSHLPFDDNRNEAFTAKETSYNWKIDTDDNGYTFMIKTEDEMKCLHPDDDTLAFDEDRRRTFISQKTDSLRYTEWRFEYMQDNSFRLLNVDFDEYFYAAFDELKYDETNRRVFTWMLRGGDGKAFKWEMEF